MEPTFETVRELRPDAWRQLHDLPDDALVERARDHDRAAFEALIRRHVRRVFRITRSVLRDGAAAEEAVRETCLRAFATLDTYAPTGRFGAWLTRLAFNEALTMRRRARGDAVLSDGAEHPRPEVEELVETAHARALLEHAIDGVPEHFRIVFVLRVVQGLDVRETAESLDLNETTVRTRLFRAHRHLREELTLKLREESSEIFDIGTDRCDRVVADVLDRIAD